VLTRVDGDGRGGAALSMRAVTGKPIKLIGTGEKMDALEDFDPRASPTAFSAWATSSRWSRRRRDISTRKRRAHRREACARARSIWSDLREQLSQMQKMGGIGGLMGMMPGVAKMKNQLAAANLDEKLLKRQMRDHRLDDAAGAAQSRHSEGQPQEAHRGRLRHQGRGDQQAAQDAPAWPT
jgi:signal recognition particle subunit SRP54